MSSQLFWCLQRRCLCEWCRRSFVGVCRGGVSVSDLCRRTFFGVCRGGVCVSDLRRRTILAFAEEVSV